ncbi:MAG: hypothetical protein WAW17_02495 [Rhodococcus sp. (in: high G+C Gram-positive bacteria)]|uniref:hypothetical protein n=1 Tax=Rhodococcus sp. TaxID=1831 RepID=UPI003BB07A04
MTASPISGQHTYVTVEQTAKARDLAVEKVRESLKGFDPLSEGEVPELVFALTKYKVDYREVADGVGVSGLDILQILSRSIRTDDDIAQVYRAGLAAERQAIEEYREKVIDEQRTEVVRLLTAGRPITSVARDVGVTRTAARGWWESERLGEASFDTQDAAQTNEL